MMDLGAFWGGDLVGGRYEVRSFDRWWPDERPEMENFALFVGESRGGGGTGHYPAATESPGMLRSPSFSLWLGSIWWIRTHLLTKSIPYLLDVREALAVGAHGRYRRDIPPSSEQCEPSQPAGQGSRTADFSRLQYPFSV